MTIFNAKSLGCANLSAKKFSTVHIYAYVCLSDSFIFIAIKAEVGDLITYNLRNEMSSPTIDHSDLSTSKELFTHLKIEEFASIIYQSVARSISSVELQKNSFFVLCICE